MTCSAACLLSSPPPCKGISHSTAAEIESAFYTESDIDLDDVTVSVPSSKRRRASENNFVADKFFEDLTREVHENGIPLSLHIDTKQLEQRMLEMEQGEGEGGAQGKKTDRLAIVVSGPSLQGDKLVGVPGLEGGTAEEQTEGAYASLCMCDLHRYIASLVYDTTATNTGRVGGTVRRLQDMLGGHALICCPCRR